MKRLQIAMLTSALLMGGAAVSAAESQPASQAQSKEILVLVAVNSNGHVTAARHAEKLPDSLEKLLRSNLDAWIVKPASENGRHVDSTMLVKVNLNTGQNAKGQNEAYFTYVSAQPIPAHRSWKIEGGNVIATGGDYRPDQNQKDAPLSSMPGSQTNSDSNPPAAGGQSRS